MMHPMMPPATGPTGALLIMFKDATSSSGEQTESREEGQGHLKDDPRQEAAFLRILNDFLLSLTHESKAVCIGTLCTNDAPETLFLQGTIRLVQVSFAITVNCAPLAVQHAKTVTETRPRSVLVRRIYI